MEIIEVNKHVASTKSFEAFNSIRANLLYTENARVLALTSTHPDEGKTISSLHLATSFAALGKKTLLIDCDLRRSSLNTLLSISRRQTGLSEILTSQTKTGVVETDIPNLSVLPAGKRPPNPSELLSHNHFQELIEDLKCKYDYIVIDTPPAGAVMDAAIVGHVVDAMVLVVANEQTKKNDVKRAKYTLERNGARIVGVILNRVKKDQVDYSSYGYGKYYY